MGTRSADRLAVKRDTLGLLRCPRTGGPLAVDVLEERDGEVEHAVLRGPGGEYPVLSGIAVLTSAGEAVVPGVREGRWSEAAARVAFGDRPASRAGSLAAVLASPALPRVAHAAAGLLGRRGSARDVAVLQDDDPMAVLHRDFVLGRPSMPDAFAYFRYRFSMPRHLVALSVIEATREAPGPLVDIGCGAGHMTWSLTQLRPDATVVGLDRSFAQLLVARRLVCPAADLVCGDVRSLPFATGQFGAAYSFDVFSFVQDKATAAREAARVVAREGTLAITSVKDADRDHVYAGMPLTVAGWTALFDGDVQVFDDLEVERRYLRGERLPDPGTQAAPVSPTITLLTSGSGLPPRFPAWRGWAHAVGPLGVNPLYRSESGTSTLLRDVPEGSYGPDNARLLEYLPASVDLPGAAIEAASEGGTCRELDDLVEQLVVLSLPPGYRPERWAGADRSVGQRDGVDSDGRATAW